MDSTTFQYFQSLYSAIVDKSQTKKVEGKVAV